MSHLHHLHTEIELSSNSSLRLCLSIARTDLILETPAVNNSLEIITRTTYFAGNIVRFIRQ